MFDSLLVANRGEIACRVMRTARRLGLRVIAVYSDADVDARHVRCADEALRIGPAKAAQSYLDISAVLEAARQAGVEAIHPGYGFLSENADFAAACERAGVVFIGPPAGAIRVMGSKIEAKRVVAAAGTATLPGYHGDDGSEAALTEAARSLGFPLLIKASAGGGGKGMRRVTAEAEFADALRGAQREAAAAFGDDRVLLERYLDVPKHLEVQVLADQDGHILHLFERDCSVQRRHQKVIEEAPGPTVPQGLRDRLGAAAVRVAAAIDYVGAGTVEFLAQDDEFYFMEMNTRLQVEHPVTEAITGLDLVEWQLRIAAGEQLPFAQDEVLSRGHAIEARIYSENPRNRFLPSTGTLRRVKFAGDVRVDAGVATGDEVSVHYDPLLAKVVAHGSNRNEAIAALDRALAGTEIAGVQHNVAYLRAVLAHGEFRGGAYTTGFAEARSHEVISEPDPALAVCALLGAQRLQQQLQAGAGAWGRADGFRVNAASRFVRSLRRGAQTLALRLERDDVWVDGSAYRVGNVRWQDDALSCRIDDRRVQAQLLHSGDELHVMCGGDTQTFSLIVHDSSALDAQAGAAGPVLAPMPGQVITVAVTPGEHVQPGATLLVIEAMKMEHTVSATRAGVVDRVNCIVGQRVEDGAELVTWRADDGGDDHAI